MVKHEELCDEELSLVTGGNLVVTDPKAAQAAQEAAAKKSTAQKVLGVVVEVLGGFYAAGSYIPRKILGLKGHGA